MILFKIIHKDFVSGWADYQKTGSFRNGARWNSPGTPVMYLSSNIQNAMLEIANYSISPRMANKLFRMAVFEFASLRLYEMSPEDLPVTWNADEHGTDTQEIGDKLLSSDSYDGFMAPSAAINNDIVRHPLNDVRRSAYGNVIVNIEKYGQDKAELIDSYSPIFSQRMFSGTEQ
ncbi:hypothetical protein R50073_49560 (plasmid) [Maricurvus nonylphenolicus]